MKAALYILFGASLTSATSLALGLILFRGLRLRLQRGEERLLAFVTGSALLSAIVFALCCLHMVYKGVFLAVAIAAIGWAIRIRAFRSPPEEALPPIPRRWRWLLGVVFGVFTVLYFFNAMAPEMSPDGTAYHLPMPAAYYRAHGFIPITWNIYANISEGIEMLFLFAFAFGKQSAASLVHFNFLATLPWLMIAYGRRSAIAAAAVAGALFFFVSPVVGMDGSSAYIDVALAAVLFALFYLLQIWDAQRDARLLIPAGILAGFAFSAKYTALLAVPYVLGFVGWKLWRARKPVWRPLTVMAALMVIFIMPWLIKNWIWIGNPVAPFANRQFPNPHVHVSFEDQYRVYLRDYSLASYRTVPYELTLGGQVLCGLFGPLFLLTPIALLALRKPQGRQLWLAGAIFALPYFTNIGTRFLIPSAPFLSIALAMAFMNWEWLLIALVLTHAVLSWPDVLKHYCARNAWRLDKIPVKQALRIEPESSYMSRKFPGFLVDQMLQKTVPAGGQVFSFSQIPEAYTSRRVLVRDLSASNELLGDMLWTPLIADFRPTKVLAFRFPERAVRELRAVTTKGSSELMWSVAEFRAFDRGRELARSPAWRLSAKPNPWDVQLAFDNTADTRWRSWQPAQPGMFIAVDFGARQKVDGVILEMPPDWRDAAVRIEALDDAGRWVTLSNQPSVTERPVRENLRLSATNELKARGVRYLLIGNDDIGAEDFQQRAAFWGIRFLEEKGYMRLYYIE
jgi:hypothetical protein